MEVNVKKLLKMVKNGDFSKYVRNGEMLKNVGENIKKNFIALIIFYTLDIKNNIFCKIIIIKIKIFNFSINLKHFTNI